MVYTTLIQPLELAALQETHAAPLLVVDCSFDLGDLEAGRRGYAAGHIPGARYVHLETTLSAPKTGLNGRHPLPTREAFAAVMNELGMSNDTQVVAYDSAAGMYASRLWWMLRWAGHAAVAVLDGGLPAWRAQGLPVTAEISTAVFTETPAAAAHGHFSLRAPLNATVNYDDMRANLASAKLLVLDARAADRFRGENETMDPVGGHIPGARNRCFRDNLDADNRFKPGPQLRAEFDAVTGGLSPSRIVNQCGSGVTACHNLLAMEVAGLTGPALYPGSWSEWCAQPGSPLATGAE
jgi:thiosulfate/3-mercaptopyruvate sulfurtransferase